MTEPSKAALRAELRAARDGFVLDLAPGERARLEARAAGHLRPLLTDARCIAFYLALGGELDCGPAIAAAAARGLAIALPHVIARDAPMRFLSWTPGDPLHPGWRGLMQPSDEAPEARPDIIVAPLVGFDSDLWRLGQGGGFYDRAFAANPQAKRIGWGWSAQEIPAVPRDSWDKRLDTVITEAGLIGEGQAL